MPISVRGWCCLVILLALPLGTHAQNGPHQGEASSVSNALSETGTASVVVALKAPRTLQKQLRRGKRLNRAVTNRRIQHLQEEVLAAVGAPGFQVTHQYESVPALAGTLTSRAAMERLATHPNVRRVDLDASGGAAFNTSLETIRADRWHSEAVTGTGTGVAVLDSGVDTDHVDLAESLSHEACFLHPSDSQTCPNGDAQQTGPGTAEDDNGHGTNVAGIIASDGTQSPRGVAPDADLVAVKVLNADGRFQSFSQIVDALDYLINHPELGVQVVNMSLGTDQQFQGTCDNTTSYNMAGADAVAMLRSQGVLPVASAMNKGSGSELASPACLESVVSVGATNTPRELADFSNSNEVLDLAAPGFRITSTGLGNRTSTYSGTSQAAPHAAGCAALLHAAGTDTTASRVEASLKTSSVQAVDSTNGLHFPFLDCYTPRATVVVNEIRATPEETERSPTPSFTLRWRTVREESSEAFVVERRPGSPPSRPNALPAPSRPDWTSVGRVSSKAAGSSTDTLRYQFEDTVPTPGQYAFRLRHATRDGSDTGQPTRAATVLDVPFNGAVALGGPQPNPARGQTEIEVVAERTQTVQVALYDVLGRRVQRLYEGPLRAKRPLVLRTDAGNLASGTYIVRAVGDRFTTTRKMVVVR